MPAALLELLHETDAGGVALSGGSVRYSTRGRGALVARDRFVGDVNAFAPVARSEGWQEVFTRLAEQVSHAYYADRAVVEVPEGVSVDDAYEYYVVERRLSPMPA